MLSFLVFVFYVLSCIKRTIALSDEGEAVFTAFERYFYEYDRKDLNKGQPVPYFFLTKAHIPELEALESLCANATERSDFAINALFRDHPWRSFDDPEDGYFIFVPTFAGIILNGQCKPEATEKLITVLRKLQDYEAWKSPQLHGHPFIIYSSTEAVHERLLNRTTAIFNDGYRYDKDKLSSSAPPEELIDYALSQMINIERFLRPTLQYCQLLSPPLTVEDHKAVEETNYQFPPSIPSTYQRWLARPLQFFMAEFLDDPTSPKYAVRRAVFEDFAKNPPANSLTVLLTRHENSSVLAGYERACDLDTSTGLVSLKEKFCHIRASSDADAEKLRLQGMKKSRFAVITRGATPHETNLYQALSGGAIVINTIDKTLTMAAPFQCEVPWEDFTIRLRSESMKTEPIAVISAALGKVAPTKLSKMLKIAQHFLPDLSISSSATAGKRLVENLLLDALRQCTFEQLNLPRGFSGVDTRCPFTLWTERNLLMRTTFNVDPPPWSEF